MFCHRDRIRPIQSIEEYDIAPLVAEGKAYLVRGKSHDGSTSQFYVRVYELLLRTNWKPICLAIRLRFAYDHRIGRATLSMSDLHAYLLSIALNGQTTPAEGAAIRRIVYGSNEPWRITLK